MLCRLIAVITDRVGKAHEVEPHHSHALTEMGRRQQLVDELFVCTIARVSDKCIHHLGSGW